jgi:hypothetical protein
MFLPLTQGGVAEIKVAAKIFFILLLAYGFFHLYLILWGYLWGE